MTGATGLSSTEAKTRLTRFGPNLFRERPARSLLLQYLTRFRNPLVIILLVASAVSTFTGEVTNFLITMWPWDRRCFAGWPIETGC